MKAFILKEPEKLEIVDMEPKEPDDNEVQIKTMACGICGTDFHAYHGKHLAVWQKMMNLLHAVFLQMPSQLLPLIAQLLWLQPEFPCALFL